jgi:UDP-glucose 4-epimerase
MSEDMRARPYSPYGVTKLAAENLGMLYHMNFDMRVVSLRFFTVYGPRQRPDMAFTRFLSWLYDDEPITVYGDGTQTRDFTYIDDVVSAVLKSVDPEVYGNIYNVGGGQRVELNDVINLMEDVSGREFRRQKEPVPEGDVPHTDANTDSIRSDTDWEPNTSLREGITNQWDWICDSPLVRQAVS